MRNKLITMFFLFLTTIMPAWQAGAEITYCKCWLISAYTEKGIQPQQVCNNVFPEVKSESECMHKLYGCMPDNNSAALRYFNNKAQSNYWDEKTYARTLLNTCSFDDLKLATSIVSNYYIETPAILRAKTKPAEVAKIVTQIGFGFIPNIIGNKNSINPLKEKQIIKTPDSSALDHLISIKNINFIGSAIEPNVCSGFLLHIENLMHHDTKGMFSYITPGTSKNKIPMWSKDSNHLFIAFNHKAKKEKWGHEIYARNLLNTCSSTFVNNKIAHWQYHELEIIALLIDRYKKSSSMSDNEIVYRLGEIPPHAPKDR